MSPNLSSALATILRNNYTLSEDTTQPQIVRMDVPFLIRLLEVVREDVKSDDELHTLVTQLLSQEGVLSMVSAQNILQQK